MSIAKSKGAQDGNTLGWLETQDPWKVNGATSQQGLDVD